MDDIATLVRKALVSEDISAFAELLDPDVTWGAPGARTPSCKSRNQVLAWYERGRDAGVRGSVYDLEVLGTRLLVSMSVRGTENAQERGGVALRFQVLTVRDSKIVEIVGFDDKTEALAYIATTIKGGGAWPCSFINGVKIEIVGLDGSRLRRLVLDQTKDHQRIP